MEWIIPNDGHDRTFVAGTFGHDVTDDLCDHDNRTLVPSDRGIGDRALVSLSQIPEVRHLPFVESLFEPFAGERAGTLARKVVDHFGGIGHALTAPHDGLTDLALIEACQIMRAARALVDGALSEMITGNAIKGLTTELIRYLQVKIGNEPVEKMHVIFLNRDHRYLRDETFIGYERRSLRIGTRAILARALELDASRILIAHNHPSGDATPSGDDVSATQALKLAAAALEIDLVDHLILTRTKHFSFRAGGRL